jgi:hypothetical protein
MTKKSLLCGAALSVLMAAPALAQGTLVYGGPPQPGSAFYGGSSLAAQLEVGIGGVSFGHGDTFGLFEGVGRIGAPLSGNWRTQIDAIGAGVFDASYAGGLGGAVAHFYTEPGQGAVGGFVGAAFVVDSPLVVVGVEAAHRWDRSVLKASASYTFVTHYSDANFFTLTGSYSYYPNPNGRLGLYASYSGGNEPGSLFRLGVDGDMMLPCGWTSIGGRIGLISYSDGSSESGVEALGRVNFYSWRNATLRQQDDALPWRDSTMNTIMTAY